MRERVTTDQIKLARTVDLISYMQQYEPEELIRTGPHDYKTATHLRTAAFASATTVYGIGIPEALEAEGR